MKKFIQALGCAALITAALPAQAVLVTRVIEGDIMATAGSLADVGAGQVTGYVQYDDAAGGAGLAGGTLFDLVDFELAFSNGPVVGIADDPFATVEIDASSGDLLGFFTLVFGVSGFGLADPLDLVADGFSTQVSFADLAGSSQVEGVLRFEAAPSDLPEPAAFLLIALSLAGVAGSRRGSRSG